jgi:chromate reductase, NAD(P)H dehydrogenase (quinone)
MKIVAISGSLRARSSNGAILRAVAACAPSGMEVAIYEDLGRLPHFNPDLDDETPPQAVTELRALLAPAQGLIISTPEYAHGIPGALKNALDWLVSSGELNHKPVLLINASPTGGEHAQASLVPTLTVMDARVLLDASLRIPFGRNRLDPDGNLSDPQLLRGLRASLATLAEAVPASVTATSEPGHSPG